MTSAEDYLSIVAPPLEAGSPSALTDRLAAHEIEHGVAVTGLAVSRWFRWEFGLHADLDAWAAERGLQVHEQNGTPDDGR